MRKLHRRAEPCSAGEPQLAPVRQAEHGSAAERGSALLLLLASVAFAQDIRIGYFGPAEASHPVGGTVWMGASLAIDEANAAGGYRGRQFQLVPVWSDNPWKGGVGALARLVFQDDVVAILGSIDSAGGHLAEQVTTKALLPLVNPAATDRTMHGAFVPWIFSVPPGDRAIAPVLAEAVSRPFALISGTDHDSRQLAAELDKARLEPALHVEIQAGTPDLAGAVERALSVHPRAVLLLAGPLDSAAVLSALRNAKFDGTIVGGPAFGRSSFLARAGSQAEGALLPVLPAKVDKEFAARFRARYSQDPDWAAAHAYDAAAVLVAAVRKAGLDRSAIRDALMALRPCQGVSGVIDWDPRGQNQRPVRLGIIRAGRVEDYIKRR